MSDGTIVDHTPVPLTVGRIVHVYTGVIGGPEQGPYAGLVTGFDSGGGPVIAYLRPERREWDWSYFPDIPGEVDGGGNRWEWPPRA